MHLGDNSVYGRGEVIRGRPELYREGRLSPGKRGNCPFPRQPQSQEDPAREKGKDRVQRELPWQVSELTLPCIHTGRLSGKSLPVPRAGLGRVLRVLSELIQLPLLSSWPRAP